MNPGWPAGTPNLVRVRHGESEANRDNRFTGWLDPPLTARGIAEARAAGATLAAQGLSVRTAFASPLLRAVASCALVLEALGQAEVRPRLCEALVERDYGELSGMDRDGACERWPPGQVERWRRSYAEAPPGGESLRDTAARVMLGYVREILPAAMRGTTLVVAHRNSLRALVMALDGLSPDEVEDLELPTCAMRLYTLAPDTAVLSQTSLEPNLHAVEGGS
ncbi:phosphoglycerate mutase [Methylobacterium oryzae]|uniref:phosphoglycerate mutase (2,3-diphosphoglycerate-dependent) n=1 Tax=Methylobacterium oryzae TaxID=334852 RepID=A0ABU7TQU8_9HYPH